MKFINYLETITGVAIYPLISLLLFLVFFIAVTLYAFKLDKKYISKLENIPLGKPEEENLFTEKKV